MKQSFYILLFVFLITTPALVKADNNPVVSYPPNYATPANGARLNLTFQNQSFAITQAMADSWFAEQTVNQNNMLESPPLPLRETLLESVGQNPQPAGQLPVFHYRLSSIYSYLQTLTDKINRQAVEPDLQIQDNKVSSFTPPQTGQTLDVYQSTLNTLTALELGQHALDLTVYTQTPKTNLAQTNTLGIGDLIGEGVSKFNGSPKNRRFNIAVGVEKMKGILVSPGETFSFDDNLGPVDGQHGFLPELVIDNGTTLPEFGGGLCQVSTTAFRAAMASGLPITARRNHAYAVQYYSPQGTDATIYPGSADLKFVNDTPGTILIWPYEKDTNTLVFDFYGTGDNRKVVLQQPVVFDRQPDGSMKATWTRIVTAADNTIKADVFKSAYQSPALFHKTETFVSATGAPVNGLKTPVAKPQ